MFLRVILERLRRFREVSGDLREFEGDSSGRLSVFQGVQESFNGVSRIYRRRKRAFEGF